MKLRNLLAMITGRAAATPAADPRLFVLDMLPHNSIGAEIGVHTGEFSAAMLARVAPRELHLIDPWLHETAATYKKAWYGGQARGGQAEMDARYQAVCARFASEIQAGRVIIHRECSEPALSRCPDAHFDWIYIDGNHLYEFAKQDLALSFQKVKPGGLICGDDYTPGGWWRGGVKQAVDEFVRDHQLQSCQIIQKQYFLTKLA